MRIWTVDMEGKWCGHFWDVKESAHAPRSEKYLLYGANQLYLQSSFFRLRKCSWAQLLWVLLQPLRSTAHSCRCCFLLDPATTFNLILYLYLRYLMVSSLIAAESLVQKLSLFKLSNWTVTSVVPTHTKSWANIIINASDLRHVRVCHKQGRNNQPLEMNPQVLRRTDCCNEFCKMLMILLWYWDKLCFWRGILGK